MGKRTHEIDDHENSDLKRHKSERREKKEKKKDKKDKKDRKDKKEKKKEDKKEDTTVEPEQSTNFRNFAIHDLISIEHSISLIQENLKKLIETSPNATELKNYINSLVQQSLDKDSSQNGEVAAKVLLLAKSHKIQLASQIKSLYDDNKLPIFNQIINFNDNTVLDSVDDVQLLIKEKRQEQYNSQKEEDDINYHSILPKLPVIYDSILESKVFIHKSATNSNLHSSKLDQVQSNNERLEFLGDAVLETIVSDIIESKYPSFDEGQLTLLRSTLVKNETIEIISRAYKFPEWQQELLKSHLIKTELDINSKFKNNKRIADLFEAYIGAIFIDKGRNGDAYNFIKSWLMDVYKPILDEFEQSDKLTYSHLSKNLIAKFLKNNTKISSSSSSSTSFSTASKIAIPSVQLPKIPSLPTPPPNNTLPENTNFPIRLTSSDEVNKLAKPELYALIGSAKLHPEYKCIQKQITPETPTVVECSIGGEILGYGEGRNLKDASARAAQASLLNKKLIEKYHLIRMMTPRTESVVSKKFESIDNKNSIDNKDINKDNNTTEKIEEVKQPTEIKETPKTFKYLKVPYSIPSDELNNISSNSKNELIQLFGNRHVIPQFTVEQDTTTKSILPVFRTTLKVNNITIASCIEASKKKGVNKVSRWLLNCIHDHGSEAIFNDLDIK